MLSTNRSIKQIKLEAKLLKKERGIQYSKALEEISQRHGYQSWHQANKQNHATDQLQTKQQYPFRFIMDRKESDWDFSKGGNSDYIEDDDLFESVLAVGLEKGFDIQEAHECMADLIFLRHQSATPTTPLEAVKIITDHFFFPPLCIWLDGVEYTRADDPNFPLMDIWQGYSHKEFFDQEEFG
ncbi:hypothetical protein [Methylomonas rosea]|uniref:Uncharacterized protein n=1 Tax=Methylomonas rosea TaxID=2952227 RepID=A0ABT1TVT6_9GAMM|nr:hypothetical protein [Methylomonas sp. WSC-7]MCQ8118501.1 hypothetical protein [Methylomonas sp. WSC-7]PPD24634.1 MAG: hypothetical protein CTY24_00155 [Methylobacter sp.]